MDISRRKRLRLDTLDLKFIFLKVKTRRVNPKTNAIFVTFDPTTLPIIIPPLFSTAANRVVSISGAEVPNAITVDPIKKGERPKLLETKTEYFSNLSALTQTRAMPGIKYKNRIDSIKFYVDELQVQNYFKCYNSF